MKKKILAIILLFSVMLFTACEEKVDNTPQLKAYKSSMSSFFEGLEKIDVNINSIDPDNQDSIDELLKQFDALEAQFKILADIEVPAEFVSNEALADQAYEYIVSSNDYLHQAFTDTSYNQDLINASLECYKRANKRVQFIITILHGEIPQDESITVQ